MPVGQAVDAYPLARYHRNVQTVKPAIDSRLWGHVFAVLLLGEAVTSIGGLLSHDAWWTAGMAMLLPPTHYVYRRLTKAGLKLADHIRFM
jgi:hypothetical protein